MARTGQQWPWLILWSVPAVLFAATAYELGLLLDLWGSYGSVPGAGVDGEERVADVAHLTMLVGAVVAAVHAIRPRAPSAVALFAPAAAAFMITRFYTYDPYHLPSLHRYSEGMGAWAAAWFLGMLAAALFVSVRTRQRPRAGSIATACILPVLLITSVLAVTH